MTQHTLGYHRDMSKAFFGENSEATKFLDKKIAESPRGRDELVLADETQLVHVLIELHKNGAKS
jgi:hypothetical protein